VRNPSNSLQIREVSALEELQTVEDGLKQGTFAQDSYR
jgi:hypothetical protein